MIIDIAKLLFQKDTREGLKELIDFIKKKPEWKADLLSLDERLSYEDRSKAGLVVQFMRQALLKKEWLPKRAGVVEFVVQEVVDNAFQHGKPPDGTSGSVRIKATLTSYWASCSVADAGQGFSLTLALEEQARGEPRGLSRVRELSSSLVQEDPSTIEVTVLNDPGKIDVSLIDAIYVVTLAGRVDHQSAANFENGLEALQEPTASVLIDLSAVDYISSVGLRVLMVLRKRLVAAGQKSVLVVKPESVVAEILAISRFDRLFPCVGSRAEAIAKLRDL